MLPPTYKKFPIGRSSRITPNNFIIQYWCRNMISTPYKKKSSIHGTIKVEKMKYSAISMI